MTAEVLWPQREGLYDLMKLRASIGRAAFGSEKQNDPINPEACEWPPDYFDYPGFWFTDWPVCQPLVLALDPSKGRDSRVGDFWSYVLLGLDRKHVLHCEAWLQRGPTDVMIDTGLELIQRFRPDAFGIEINTFQELLVAPFQEKANAKRVDLPVHTFENAVNKVVRIRRLTPDLAQKRIRFKARSPGTQLMIDQMKIFPIGDHDDGPDALEMAKRLLIELWNGKQQDRQAQRVRS